MTICMREWEGRCGRMRGWLRVHGGQGREDTKIFLSGWWEYSRSIFNICLNFYNYL